MKETKRQKVKTSIYTGVYRRESDDTFYAQIKINGKNTYLGSFSTEEEAAYAHMKAKSGPVLVGALTSICSKIAYL